MNRVTEISFNSSLMREMRAVAFVTKLIDDGKLCQKLCNASRAHSRPPTARPCPWLSAKAAAEAIQASGLKAETSPFDVTDERASESAIDAVVTRFGRLDIMVANAGINHRVPLPDWTPADWDQSPPDTIRWDAMRSLVSTNDCLTVDCFCNHA
jgi:hypothetical protein